MTNTLRISIVSLLSLVFVLSTGWALADEPEQIAGGKEFLEGRRLQGAGDWGASIERFRAAADLYSLVADYALYQIAQSALQVGDTDSSASALEELLRLHPDCYSGGVIHEDFLLSSVNLLVKYANTLI